MHFASPYGTTRRKGKVKAIFISVTLYTDTVEEDGRKKALKKLFPDHLARYSPPTRT